VDRSWSWVGRVAAGMLAFNCGLVLAQFHRHRTQPVAASTSLTFMKKDGSCVTGPIVKIEPRVVTVRDQRGSVAIPRQDLLQVSQGDSLVFSARSSWADIEDLHLRPRESLTLKLRNGKLITERPLRITADGFVYKRFLWLKKNYAKAQIMTVDYLRMKPDSDEFDYFTQEAPALLFFYPESYDRLSGLEGRIPVRLYDAVRPEDDAALKCSSR
jgi:hypothetical protein